MKIYKILLLALPILGMILLIPAIENDYLLALIDAVIIFWSFRLLRAGRKELLIFLFGLIIMSVCEYLFVSTGVETFVRHSFLGYMPLWLPLLWGYGFVAIEKSAKYL